MKKNKLFHKIKKLLSKEPYAYAILCIDLTCLALFFWASKMYFICDNRFILAAYNLIFTVYFLSLEGLLWSKITKNIPVKVEMKLKILKNTPIPFHPNDFAKPIIISFQLVFFYFFSILLYLIITIKSTLLINLTLFFFFPFFYFVEIFSFKKMKLIYHFGLLQIYFVIIICFCTLIPWLVPPITPPPIEPVILQSYLPGLSENRDLEIEENMESFFGIYEKYSVIAYDLEGNKIFLRYEKWKCDVNWIFKYYAKKRKKDLYGETTFSMVFSIECYEDEIQGLLGKRYLFISDDTFIDMTTNLPLPGETRKQFLEENLIEGE